MNETEIEALKTDISWIKNLLEKQIEALERMEKQLCDGADKCRARHEKIDRELGELSVRASLLGTVAGLISGGVVAILGIALKIIMK